MLPITEDQRILKVKLMDKCKYEVEGFKMLADNELIIEQIRSIIKSIFNDGFNKIDYTNNLFEVIMVKNKGDFHLVLGTGQRYKLLTLYKKQFSDLCDSISLILIDSVYNRTNRKKYVN
jgi:hypothetical protein